MFCHKCGNPLSAEVKFCPKCGEMVLGGIMNGEGIDWVELNVISTGSNDEIFANMKFDIFADDRLIGNVPGTGTSVCRITCGQHCIKIGVADICLNIPSGEPSVTLEFIWSPNGGQRINCQQSSFVTSVQKTEIFTSKNVLNKGRKMSILVLITISIAVVSVIMVFFTKSKCEDDGSLAVGHFTDMDSDDKSTIPNTKESEQDRTVADKAMALEAYAEKVQEIIEQDSTFLFDLIDLDGNDIPELVADCPGYSVSLFTWADGKIITLMGDWAYGAMGNNGYNYLPGRNIIHNYNMEQAGAVVSESYLAINKYYDLTLLSSELRICFFNDINRNGMIDVGEDLCDDPYYYFGDAEITREEYASYQIEGDYESISGDKTAEEILSLLSSEKKK